MRDERLLTFVYGFLIDADALILGQQRPLCPWPEVCSCDQDMGLGAGIDAEMNISATGVSVVFGAPEAPNTTLTPVALIFISASIPAPDPCPDCRSTPLAMDKEGVAARVPGRRSQSGDRKGGSTGDLSYYQAKGFFDVKGNVRYDRERETPHRRLPTYPKRRNTKSADVRITRAHRN